MIEELLVGQIPANKKKNVTGFPRIYPEASVVLYGLVHI
jgi:hypothetical protein